MNFLEISKRLMNGEKIFNIPLRVCFYARVSTDSDIQLNSLNNQLSYYENYIKSKESWSFIKGYIDEGISGVRVEKRQAFQEMIDDAKKGKFDLIITKEVSRFARDLEDSIHYIRILKDANVGIYFENQNLNTFDSNSELILNIMFNLAQEESKKLSARVKFGHNEAIKKGHVLGSSNIIGYKKDKCKLVIVENEAKFIRKVFELYASGKYGFYKLSKKLSFLGYLNSRGNLYDKDTLKRIIENPKYKGFYRGKVCETIDYRSKKRIKIDKDNQVIYECSSKIVPPIVSCEIWNQANKILESRTNNNKNINCFRGSLKYPFSSKIYCKEHNTCFQRSHGNRRKNRPTWCCSKYLQYGLDNCSSPIIAEVDLYNIMSIIIDKLLPDKKSIIENMVKLYKCSLNNGGYDKELNIIDKQLKIMENKKSFMLDLVYDGTLSKAILKDQFKNIEEKIEDLRKQNNEILRQKNILMFNQENDDLLINSIKEVIGGELLGDFIRKFVDEIVISKINGDRSYIKMDIYLNLLVKEKVCVNGASHINGPLEEDVLYLENQKIDSVELLRKDRKVNKYNYSVYMESL